jgi:signal transduction histidine kinase
VKEALNNIVRHANATEVEFRMAVTDGGLEIDVADNGKGFNNATASPGHGLKNLPARLQKLGGSCTVEPRPSGGIVVKIRLPLAATAGVSPAPEANGKIRHLSDSAPRRVS